MRHARVLITFGTRPEAIKMAPLVQVLRETNEFKLTLCVTAQHRDMLDQVLDVFQLRPDHDLDLMAPNQNLTALTARVIEAMHPILVNEHPDLVLVQGDTTTTLGAALASYYNKIPVAHVEAGLRTYHRYAPFPEEMNRRICTSIADWHFPPTARAARALLNEGVPDDSIHVVGNTIVDALLSTIAKLQTYNSDTTTRLEAKLDKNRVVLITGHRRENFGNGFESICHAIHRLALLCPQVQFVFPVHLNPNVQTPVKNILSGLSNVHLIAPMNYLDFVWLLDRSHLLLTDSGGIQEEAPSLGKPVLVMRDTTERPEGVEAGVARLVGTTEELIVRSVLELLDDDSAYTKMSQSKNPYGDGTAARQIGDILAAHWRAKMSFHKLSMHPES